MKQKQEKSHTEGIACQQWPLLWMLQGCTHCREAHVVAERVAENRPYQVSCADEEESCISTEDSGVGELERCRHEDTSHTALAEAQLLNNVVKMGDSKKRVGR